MILVLYVYHETDNEFTNTRKGYFLPHTIRQHPEEPLERTLENVKPIASLGYIRTHGEVFRNAPSWYSVEVAVGICKKLDLSHCWMQTLTSYNSGEHYYRRILCQEDNYGDVLKWCLDNLRDVV